MLAGHFVQLLLEYHCAMIGPAFLQENTMLTAMALVITSVYLI